MSKCFLCEKDLEKDFASVSINEKLKVCFDCFFEDILKNPPSDMEERNKRVNERAKQIE